MRAFYFWVGALLLAHASGIAGAQTALPPRPTPLRELVQELQQQSPSVIAGRKAFEASQNTARQASALPDTNLMVQHVAVGSPRPFAGFTNSDFAYIGFGASQDLPFPGKRKLRGEVAQHDSEVLRVNADVILQDAVLKLSTAYVQLSYLQSTLALLQESSRSLGEIEKIVESRYRVGQGNQQEVLKAQLQNTRILIQFTMHHREAAKLQAEIKGLLNRTQQSPDIVAETLSTTAIPVELSTEKGLEVRARQSQISQAQVRTRMASLERKPDFNVQYMWQHTDSKFRDYYMATLGLRLPNRGRVQAAIAEARAKQEQADAEYQATQSQVESAIQQKLVVVHTSDEQLKIYREGLIPQSTATMRAASASYESGKQDFETLISAFNDVLQLEIEARRELATREIAVAELERLTGVTLR